MISTPIMELTMMSYVTGSPNQICHCFVLPFLMWFEFKTGYVLELKRNCLLIGPVRIIFSLKSE